MFAKAPRYPSFTVTAPSPLLARHKRAMASCTGSLPAPDAGVTLLQPSLSEQEGDWEHARQTDLEDSIDNRCR